MTFSMTAKPYDVKLMTIPNDGEVNNPFNDFSNDLFNDGEAK